MCMIAEHPWKYWRENIRTESRKKGGESREEERKVENREEAEKRKREVERSEK